MCDEKTVTVICPDEFCQGAGHHMTMVCYGGNPFEKYTTCPVCDGEGTVEILESDYVMEKLSGKR